MGRKTVDAFTRQQAYFYPLHIKDNVDLKSYNMILFWYSLLLQKGYQDCFAKKLVYLMLQMKIISWQHHDGHKYDSPTVDVNELFKGPIGDI